MSNYPPYEIIFKLYYETLKNSINIDADKEEIIKSINKYLNAIPKEHLYSYFKESIDLNNKLHFMQFTDNPGTGKTCCLINIAEIYSKHNVKLIIKNKNQLLITN